MASLLAGWCFLRFFVPVRAPTTNNLRADEDRPTAQYLSCELFICPQLRMLTGVSLVPQPLCFRLSDLLSGLLWIAYKPRGSAPCDRFRLVRCRFLLPRARSLRVTPQAQPCHVGQHASFAARAHNLRTLIVLELLYQVVGVLRYPKQPCGLGSGLVPWVQIHLRRARSLLARSREGNVAQSARENFRSNR